MQAVARNIMSVRKRRATFLLYTIIIMKLKKKLGNAMDWPMKNVKIVSKGCKVCIDGFTRTGTTANRKDFNNNKKRNCK